MGEDRGELKGEQIVGVDPRGILVELLEEPAGCGFFILGLADAAALQGAAINPAVVGGGEVVDEDELAGEMVVAGLVKKLLEGHVGEEAGEVEVEPGDLLSWEAGGGVLESGGGAAGGPVGREDAAILTIPADGAVGAAGVAADEVEQAVGFGLLGRSQGGDGTLGEGGQGSSEQEQQQAARRGGGGFHPFRPVVPELYSVRDGGGVSDSEE